jgi:sigma-E factor negative regulatory protein RseC
MMIKQTHETATVVQTHGDTATVMINKSSACSECGKAQAGICGKGGAGMLIRVRNTAGAKQGDTVVVSLDRKTHYKAYLFAFVIPVIALFAGTYVGSILSGRFDTEYLDVIFGLFSLGLSVVYSLRIIHTLDRSRDMYISRIIHDGGAGYDLSSSPEGEDYLRAFAHK